MTTLSLIDQAMFKLEQTGMPPMYMGGAMIVDPTESPFPLDGHILAMHLAAFMESVPLMRQKLVQDKMRLGNMRLVDDPNFDVNSHITVTQLKAPGGYTELTEHLAAFSERRMDLDRPLWHYEVIEGLEGGKIAIASHLHHSVLDGVGATRVLGGLMSTEPVEPREPKNKAWSPDPEPGVVRLAGGALVEQARRFYVDTPKFVYANARPLFKSMNEQLAKRWRTSDEESLSDESAKPTVRKTSLNPGEVSDKRVVAYLDFPMADIKALRTDYNCSINDIALCINSIALEYYFEKVGEKVDFDLVAGMPINTRAADDKSAGNSLSAGMVNLHNTVADPKERLAAIVSETQEIKASSKVTGNETGADEQGIDFGALGGLFSPIVLDMAGYLISRFALFEKLPPIANVAISNVPGPSGELYFSGARVVSNIPMAPFGGPVSLTVTITSSSDTLSIGYHGCGEAIKDKELLVAGARRGFALLSKDLKKAPKKNTRSRRTSAKTKVKSGQKAAKTRAKRKKSGTT